MRRSFIRDPSLILYLPLWKKDGSNFPSDDAYGYSCTVTGALWTRQGRRFDGVAAVIQTATFPSLGNTFTVLTWFKSTAISWVVNHYNRLDFAGVEKGWILRLNTNNITLQINGNVAIDITGLRSNPIDGGFHFIGGSLNGTIGKLFYEGLEVFSTSAAAVIDYHPSQPIRLNKVMDGPAFNAGTQGEVMIYNRVLTPIEIQNIYMVTKWRYT